MIDISKRQLLAAAAAKAQTCTPPCFPQTPEESDAGVTPSDLQYPPGDVRRYGAALDGGTDDTDALQAWLDVGGNLYGAHGTARITAKLQIMKDGTFIRGREMKVLHDTSTLQAVIEAQGITGILIDSLEIDGQKSQKTGTGPQEGYGIWLRRCSNVVVRGCYVHDCFEHGIDVAALTGDTNPTTEISSHIQILGNRVVACGNTESGRGYGIWGFGLLRQLLVANNIVYNCQNGGISADDTSFSGTTGRINHRVVFANNIVSTDTLGVNGFIGMRYEGCRYGAITGNVVMSPDNALVIQSIQGNEPSELVTVSGNYLQGDRFAIRLNDANDVSVTGNVCVMPSDDTSVYRAAVDIYSQAQNPDSERIVLANNVVRSAQIGVAVGVNPATQDPSNDIDIADNSIHYIGASAATAGYDGINVLSGNRVSVRGNRVRSFGNGIDARGSVDVLENSVYNSEVYGIRLVGADARVCRGNITRGSTSAGLRIESSANNPSVIILGNVITDRTSGSTGSLTRFGNVFPGSITSALTSASAASIGNAVSGINTIGKHTGKIIRDSTNERLVYALGPNPTDGWRVADGSLTVTPS